MVGLGRGLTGSDVGGGEKESGRRSRCAARRWPRSSTARPRCRRSADSAGRGRGAQVVEVCSNSLSHALVAPIVRARRDALLFLLRRPRASCTLRAASQDRAMASPAAAGARPARRARSRPPAPAADNAHRARTGGPPPPMAAGAWTRAPDASTSTANSRRETRARAPCPRLPGALRDDRRLLRRAGRRPDRGVLDRRVVRGAWTVLRGRVRVAHPCILAHERPAPDGPSAPVRSAGRVGA